MKTNNLEYLRRVDFLGHKMYALRTYLLMDIDAEFIMAQIISAHEFQGYTTLQEAVLIDGMMVGDRKIFMTPL